MTTTTMTRRVVPSLLLVACFFGSHSFEWSSAGSRPEVNRKAIVGIWKLTPTAAQQLPMKEFTVYPKKKKILDEDSVPELLLMLKEDGSFQQYTTSINNPNDDEKDIDSSWSDFSKEQARKNQQQQQQLLGLIKGTWDYLDGNLILAADRPDDSSRPYSAVADGYAGPTATTTPNKNKEDTLLKGRVVASYQTRLQDNPVLATESSNTTTSTALDTHLSVPKGCINIGKFLYPKHHPSFFEQPMFQPVKKGTFALRQVLGSLNTERDDAQKIVEKFRRSDFYNKTFLLTSHPIGQRQQQQQQAPNKGDKRWSIKYNQFVHDPPSKKKAARQKQAAEDDDDDDSNRVTAASSSIRVLQLAFHANNTFSTVAGLGASAILRGKFDVVGSEKDQLWMQVIRFGFGRSVSGSVYSEGPMLSHEDAKAYWGTISSSSMIGGSPAPREDNGVNGEATSGTDKVVVDNTAEAESEAPEKPLRIEVTGSVLDGWGLEPSPVARFIMRETSSELDMVDDEDEEDEEEIDEEALSEEIATLDAGLEDDGIDWSSERGNSFQ